MESGAEESNDFFDEENASIVGVSPEASGKAAVPFEKPVVEMLPPPGSSKSRRIRSLVQPAHESKSWPEVLLQEPYEA